MNPSDKTNYLELFLTWKEELINQDLSPLNLDFIKNYSVSIEEIKNKSSKDRFISEILLFRIDFLINNLIELRKNKIINLFLNKKEIPTSYLSRQELFFYDYIKNSENIIKTKPITFSPQMQEYLHDNSNLPLSKEQISIEKNQANQTLQEKSTSLNKSITVIFLKDLQQFIYKNNQKFGPFKVGDVAEIPFDLFTNILFPKNYVKEK